MTTIRSRNHGERSSGTRMRLKRSVVASSNLRVVNTVIIQTIRTTETYSLQSGKNWP